MTPMFRSESDTLSGVGALVACALALVMFVFSAAVMYRELSHPTFSDYHLALLKQACEQQHC